MDPHRTKVSRHGKVILALLNSQWRGGSTIAEQLLFSTIASPSLFLLDEPAMKLITPADKRSTSSMAQVLLEALSCDFHQYNRSALVSWQVGALLKPKV